jgi:hypothetical protein
MSYAIAAMQVSEVDTDAHGYIAKNAWSMVARYRKYLSDYQVNIGD